MQNSALGAESHVGGRGNMGWVIANLGGQQRVIR